MGGSWQLAVQLVLFDFLTWIIFEIKEKTQLEHQHCGVCARYTCCLRQNKTRKKSVAHWVHWQEGMIDIMAAGEIAQGWYWKQACLHPVKCPFSLNLTLFRGNDYKCVFLTESQLLVFKKNIYIIVILSDLNYYFFLIKEKQKPPSWLGVQRWDEGRDQTSHILQVSHSVLQFCNQ